VTSIRVMTYNVRQCQGRDGRTDPERIAAVIAEAGPDVVALQDLTTTGPNSQLEQLATRLGMLPYGSRCGRRNGNGFLSWQPLRAVAEYDLGYGAGCLRADLDVDRKRVHLFTVRLDASWYRRHQQVNTLLGPDLLGSSSLPCPLLLLGDFSGRLAWTPEKLHLALALNAVQRPLWAATFPARWPLFACDRGYLRGDLRVLHACVQRSRLARQASNHLPFLLTVEINDPRTFLPLNSHFRGNIMDAAPG